MLMNFKNGFGAFRRNMSGLAALEFALALPLFIMLILGSASVFDYIQAKNRSQQSADAIADLVARSMEMSDEEFNNVMLAGEMVLGKYADKVTMKSVITGFKLVDDNTKWQVEWSKSYNTQNQFKGDKYDKDKFPTNHNKDMVVYVEVEMDYKNDIYFVEMPTLTLSKESVRLPRYTDEIEYTDEIDYSQAKKKEDEEEDEDDNGGGNEDEDEDDNDDGDDGDDDDDDGGNDDDDEEDEDPWWCGSFAKFLGLC